ncbi:MAG: N-acetyltransferase [Candidimonas sp.]|nr:MAG: N-acetyltransferase [Candidimonas sp.]TAM21290.1 MAG: N-acetyltransferase [Candidimonas sp.]
MQLTFKDTQQTDVETLVEMRVAAMRESLERIGRFDLQRARDRFVAAFDPALCRFIVVGDESVGFILIRPMIDHLLLDHLYIVPEHQGKGIGAAVLDTVFSDADAKSLPVKLGALRDSDSNHFYLHHGFVKTHESEWDIYYVHEPALIKCVRSREI